MSHKDNYGPGGFGDQFDNGRMRSMDRDQHPGGVTGIPFEDDIDLDDMDFSPKKGEAFHFRGKRSEPSRNADLGRGGSGTNWNRDIHQHQDNSYYGKGPKGWKLGDEKLREKVCECLLQSHEVDASEMDVKVEESCVYLTGFISSKGMQRVAEDLIYSIPGVEDVFTQLKIKNTSNFQLGAP